MTEENLDEGLVEYIHSATLLQRQLTFKEPKEGDKIVYAPGSYDYVNPGHVKFLKKASTLGDYLIVGLHRDEVKYISVKNRQSGGRKDKGAPFSTVINGYSQFHLLKA